MVRLGRVALELKVALENEGRLDNGCRDGLMKDSDAPRAENESLKTKHTDAKNPKGCSEIV